jgi:hypothetical protein
MSKIVGLLLEGVAGIGMTRSGLWPVTGCVLQVPETAMPMSGSQNTR